MGDKISVSYVAIVAYFSFVVAASLLVGLLPPLVNLPECKDTAASNPVPQVAPAHSLIKRDLKVPPKSVKAPEAPKIEKKKSAEKERVFNNFKGNRKEVKAPRCQEILFPENVRYPWYDARLPGDLYPTKYDLEILVPTFGLDFYIAETDLYFNVVRPTNWVLIHSKNSDSILMDFLDKNGNQVEVECLDKFPFNDYIVIKTKSQLTTANGPYSLVYLTAAEYMAYDSGFYEFFFNKPDGKKGGIFISRFEPVQAREVFPCFDEPGYKAPVSMVIDHAQDTIALFNTPAIGDSAIIPEINNNTHRTTFATTPPMPISLIGLTIFDENDFGFRREVANKNITVRLWARSNLVDEGFANAPLSEAVLAFNALEDYFSGVDSSALPPEINIFAVPEYSVDAIPNFGLLFVKESEILFKLNSITERGNQDVMLLLAKNFAEFWFGNFITHAWWDELWLQEGLADYLKYYIVNLAYPVWNIRDHYIVDELVGTLIEDAYPSSHPIAKRVNDPYEIKEYFDVVEISKAAGIVHMLDDEFNPAQIKSALTDYLNAHKWGVADIRVFFNKLGMINEKWSVEEFFMRYTEQPNYPLLNIRIVNNADSTQSINIVQSRFLNLEDSVFDTQDFYPSSYNWTWIVPVDCTFGTGTTNNDRFHIQKFYISEKTSTFQITPRSDSLKYNWVSCNRKFSGFYGVQYSPENWKLLAQSLANENTGLTDEDHANIIHNLFINAFADIGKYYEVVDALSYLEEEMNYIPWRTIYHHLNKMLDVLQYKRSFYEVSSFFDYFITYIEASIDLWSGSGSHVSKLLKETLIEISCRIQDYECLEKTSELWEIALPSLFTGRFNNTVFPQHTRDTVYSYHIQNTYDVSDWDLILKDYVTSDDLVEQKRFLDALTFTRLPWLLQQLLASQDKGELNNYDIFEVIRKMSHHPLGREIVWDFIRINIDALYEKYGNEDPRLGRMLLDVSSSFETEYMYVELLQFLLSSPSGADGNARFKALEYAQANSRWLNRKEEEIMDAFNQAIAPKTGKKKTEKKVNKENVKLLKEQHEKLYNHANDIARKYVAKSREQTKSKKF